MPQLAPEELISRHIAKLLASRPGSEEKVDQVLERVGLVRVGERVTHRNGGEVTSTDCRTYKHAVKDVFGDAVYSFAKVNFVLGGCSCTDCVTN